MMKIALRQSLLFGAVASLVAAAAHAAAPGAARAPVVGLLADPGVAVADAPAAARVSFEVYLPLRNEAALDTLIREQQNPSSSQYHRWLSPAQFAQTYSPTARSMVAARAALTDAGFAVDETGTRSLTASGSVDAANRAFATTLKSAAFRDGHTQLVAPGGLTLPAALRAQGAVVAAFSSIPDNHVDSQRIAGSVPNNRTSDHGSYYFTDLRQAYDYPALDARMANGQRLDGAGVKVAVIMSSDALDSDVAAAFNHEKFTVLTGRPAPKITHVPVNGGCTQGVNCAAFDEASLDVQQVLGGAPGASVTLLNIPSLSNADTLAAYTKIVDSNAYDVVSMSYGGCELFYTADYNAGVDNTSQLRTINSVFKQGNAQGITWIASSGDSGALSCPSKNIYSSGQVSFVAGVESPSSDPNVVAVGGGNLVTNYAPPSLDSTYVKENAYGDPENPYVPYFTSKTVYGGYWGAGGGLSVAFPQPSYQTTGVTGSSQRTVPDVGMQVGGCPGGIAKTPCGPQRSSVVVWINGTPGGLIGTSVAAPEFAGAVALFVQKSGRQGNLNTFLYRQGAAQTANSSLGYFNRAIPGFDGKYSETSTPGGGYTYLTGNGTPRVRHLFGFLDVAAAGAPQTPSNP